MSKREVLWEEWNHVMNEQLRVAKTHFELNCPNMDLRKTLVALIENVVDYPDCVHFLPTSDYKHLLIFNLNYNYLNVIDDPDIISKYETCVKNM